MKIRFLQTVASGVPGYPFQAGQVIDLPEPGPEWLALLDGVRAEAVKDVSVERAVAPVVRPAPTRQRRRRA